MAGKVEQYNSKRIKVFGMEPRVDVFITEPLGHDELAQEWENIRNRIAYKQSSIEDEFERWNHYLFYLVEEDVMNDINLKYNIEHDTLSSRKILIPRSECRNKDCFETVVNKYIEYQFEAKDMEVVEEFAKSEDVQTIFKTRQR